MLASDATSFEEKSLRLLTKVTHDLKSPMNAMIGALDYIEMLIKQGVSDAQSILDIIAVARGAGDDMAELIQSILTVSRVEAGKSHLEPSAIDNLNEVLQGMVTTFKFEAVLCRKNLVFDFDSALPEVVWDIKKIHYHVINNLISNALKFTPANGTVKVSAQLSRQLGNEAVVIRVADNGPGIPPDARRKIFDRFERVEVTSERAHKGFGLGLYTAHLFTKAHQGTIDIEDGLDGKGVAFVVRLPRYPVFHDENEFAASANSELQKQLENYWIRNLAI